MKVEGKNYRTVWIDGSSVFMIDQNLLPFEFKIVELKNYLETCEAIKIMTVRGAGAIGAAAGYAMAQAVVEAPADRRQAFIDQAYETVCNTRPTAQNLFYAAKRVYEKSDDAYSAVREAQKIAEEDAEASRMIGKFGSDKIKDSYRILTHCNAGWLAFVDYGTALSPIYTAQAEGKDIFVYADETRPRSQGSRLTAWELHNQDVPHAIIPDNAAAYYMQKGMVDMVIIGADRIAANGDVANKIGSLEKAIAAFEYNIPFYVAAPTSTFDFSCPSGNEIVIEERSQDEVLYQTGPDSEGVMRTIRVASPGSEAHNPAFDVTPAKFIRGIITEKGIVNASTEAICQLKEMCLQE